MQTRYYLDLADILCFEFECHKCHSKLTYSQKDNPTFPVACPGCKSEWNTHGASLKTMIGLMSQIKDELPSYNFNLTLEVAAPPKQHVAEGTAKK